MKAVKIALVVVLLSLGLFLFTPLGAVPVLIYGARFYPDRLAAEAEQGEPLVGAAYRYRGDTGLYPERLEDLAPAYLATAPPGWAYRKAQGRPPTLYRHGAFHCSLTYYFPGARFEGFGFPPGVADGWVLDNEGTQRFLRRSRRGPPQEPSRLSREELESRRLKELRRRAERGRDDEAVLGNYRALVSEYVRLGRLDEAEAACRRYIPLRPQGRWGRLALAELGLRGGSTAGLDELAAWFAQRPGFSAFCDLAMLDEAHGRTAEAAAALREAAKWPLDGGGGEFAPEFYAFYAARSAYRKRDYALALAVCDRWESFVGSRGWGEASYHAVRAASELALGETEKAVRDAGLAVRADQASKTWAADPGALLKAAEAGDRTFVYDLGSGRVGPLLFDEAVE